MVQISLCYGINIFENKKGIIINIFEVKKYYLAKTMEWHELVQLNSKN